MVETARLHGCSFNAVDCDDQMVDCSDPEPVDSSFYDLIRAANIFVFPSGISCYDHENDPGELDLPFKTCSFERLDDLGGYACYLINEVEPRSYQIYALTKNKGQYYLLFSSTDSMTVAFKNKINSFLRQIKHGKTGIENVKETVRIGSGASREIHKIRRIVHVCNKREYLKARSVTGKPIDWSHQWSVRGHWRRVNGLGKDRNDDYSVHGFTWVTDHIRGPEDKPFIKKTRFLKPKLGENNEHRHGNHI